MKKLSNRQVLAVFIDRKRSGQALAELYGVSRSLISQIRNRKQRTHVTDALPDYSRVDHIPLRSGNYALSPQEAKHIYMCNDLGDKQLADTFHVSVKTIVRIRTRQTYQKHTLGL